MPFTEKAPAFLFENYTRNDKEWFQSNKGTYQKALVEPFTELIEYLSPLMEKIDPEIICTPKKISRLYRDARYAKGKSIFRESIWCSLCRRKERFISKPEFYFYISPDGFGWGCGYYQTPTSVMENLRSLIIEKDKTAVAALKAFDKQSRFELQGELYKRDHFPEQPEKLKEWLNRKSLSVSFDCDDPALLFSKDLKETIRSDFESIADIYRLFIKAEEMNAGKQV